MFIINLTYVTEVEKVEQYLEQHKMFLNKHYKLGNFIISGAKKPRTGGVILSNIESKLSIEEIVNTDPFIINNIATYKIIEFLPSKTNKELSFLLKKSKY